MKSKPKFAAFVADLLRRAGDQRNASYDEERFALVMSGGDVINLHNVYASYANAGWFRREGVVRDHVQAVVDATRKFGALLTKDNLLERLVVVIRNASYVGNRTDILKRSLRPLGHRMFEILGVQDGDALGMGDAATIEKCDRPLEELFDIAITNVRAKRPNPFVEIAPGLFKAETGDNLDSGRLLLTDVVGSLAVRGEIVAMVPHAAVLFVTGSDDQSSLVLMALLAEPALADGKSISSELLVLREGRWAPFIPSGPAAVKLSALESVDRARAYEEQRELLQASATDAFVAITSVLKVDQSVVTISTVAEGIVTYLPRVDRVSFVSKQMLEASESDRGAPAILSWERVEAVLGPLQVVRDTYPVRYRVDRFPAQADLMVQ